MASIYTNLIAGNVGQPLLRQEYSATLDAYDVKTFGLLGQRPERF